MQVDSICDVGVAIIEGFEDKKSVLLLRECGMYKANDNFRALAKALYNTNKSFRTCVKVMYNTRAKALVVFSQTRRFSLSHVFMNAYKCIHKRESDGS